MTAMLSSNGFGKVISVRHDRLSRVYVNILDAMHALSTLDYTLGRVLC